MKRISVCLQLEADVESGRDLTLLENNYQSVFKKLLSFIYSHPNLHMSVAFTGPQVEYYELKHPESIELIRELTGDKRLEIIGGGFYAPVFPLAYPVDRSSQIEKMNSVLRRLVGKRPSGMYLFGSVWDPGLTVTFKSCGMDYVFLDSSVVPERHLVYKPIITGEQGKFIKVLPQYRNFVPSGEESISEWLKRLEKGVAKFRTAFGSAAVDAGCDGPLVTVPLDFESIKRCLEPAGENEGGFLESLFDEDLFPAVSEKVDFVLPSAYLKKTCSFVRAYIPSGISQNLARWASESYKETKSGGVSGCPSSIFDYLETYPLCRQLYDRMAYISLYLSQIKKKADKMRKLSASACLHEAQAGWNMINCNTGLPQLQERRQGAFRLLNDAEKFIRDSLKKWNPGLLTYDYNGDGRNEYIAQMERFSAILSCAGGQVFSFNAVKGGADYAAGLSKNEYFDGKSDRYQRAFFSDRISCAADEEDYVSLSDYVERKFDYRRNEVQLETVACLSREQLPVLVRKNIDFNSSGIVVQYILKNCSDREINAVFSSEVNFSQTRFERNPSGFQYGVELIQNENRIQLEGEKPSGFKYRKSSGVSVVLVKDVKEKRSFVIEPNENCGLESSLEEFMRPGHDGSPCLSSTSLCQRLFWNIRLDAGREVEKTVSLTYVPSKK